MRTPLRHVFAILIAVLFTGTMAVPHICADESAASASVEHQIKTADRSTDQHQDSSKAGENCCIAHHCCFAKLISPAQPVVTVTYAAETPLPVITDDHFTSFNPNTLDRPPKSFA